MNKKVLASLVVVAMLAVAIPVMVSSDEPAEAAYDLEELSAAKSTAYGEFNVFAKFGGNAWSLPISSDGYNAAIAVNDMKSGNINVFQRLGITMDTDYTIFIPSPYGDYYDINPNYGKINFPFTIAGVTYTDVTVFYYNEDLSAWKVGPTKSLGFYKPFDDYDLATANIGLYFTTASAVKVLPPSTANLKSLVNVANNDDFKVTFTFTADAGMIGTDYPGSPDHDDQIEILADSPITVPGYGSDAYLALKQITTALWMPMSAQGNVLNGNSVNTGYGSVQDLLGLLYGDNGVYWPDPGAIYYYWTLYTGSGANMGYSNWLLGFMSPMAEASGLGQDPNNVNENFVQNEFTLVYSFS